jgi:hypothetical protein
MLQHLVDGCDSDQAIHGPACEVRLAELETHQGRHEIELGNRDEPPIEPPTTTRAAAMMSSFFMSGPLSV